MEMQQGKKHKRPLVVIKIRKRPTEFLSDGSNVAKKIRKVAATNTNIGTREPVHKTLRNKAINNHVNKENLAMDYFGEENVSLVNTKKTQLKDKEEIVDIKQLGISLPNENKDIIGLDIKDNQQAEVVSEINQQAEVVSEVNQQAETASNVDKEVETNGTVNQNVDKEVETKLTVNQNIETNIMINQKAEPTFESNQRVAIKPTVSQEEATTITSINHKVQSKPTVDHKTNTNPNGNPEATALPILYQKEAQLLTSIIQKAQVLASIIQKAQAKPPVNQEVNAMQDVNQKVVIKPAVNQEAIINLIARPTVNQTVPSSSSINKEVEVTPTVQHKILINPTVNQEAKEIPNKNQQIQANPETALNNKPDNNGMILPFQCGICKEGVADLRSMKSHYMSAHNLIFGRTIKHFELLPDLHDPNNYCKSCEKSYKNIITFQHHLRTVHLIPKDFLKLQHVPDANLTHPNFRCNSRSETFVDQLKCHDHLKSVHDTSVKATIKNSGILPVWNDVNNYCRSCGYSFPTKSEYHQHCLSVHRIPLPDPDDPNFHCKICDKTHRDMIFYKNHCRDEHYMKDLPEITNIGCGHCSSIFYLEKTYMQHVERFEKRLQREALSGKETIKPDFYDPNFHCSACDRNYKSKNSYRSHLRTVHALILHPKQPRSLTKLKPNVSDPNFYCCACQRKYQTKYKYIHHLKSFHNIEKEYLERFKDASVPKIFAHPLDPNLFNLVMLHLKTPSNEEMSPLKSS